MDGDRHRERLEPHQIAFRDGSGQFPCGVEIRDEGVAWRKALKPNGERKSWRRAVTREGSGRLQFQGLPVKASDAAGGVAPSDAG